MFIACSCIPELSIELFFMNEAVKPCNEYICSKRRVHSVKTFNSN